MPTVFVRLTGCPLRCQYCDTAYAFSGGEWWTSPTSCARVARIRHALRLRHRRRAAGAAELPARCSRALCDAGYRVSLETSGALRWQRSIRAWSRVVDVKTPGSGEERAQSLRAAAALRPQRPGQVRDLRPRRLRVEPRAARASWRSPSAAACCSRPATSSCAARRARRLDPRRPPAGALPGAAAQDPVGRRARAVSELRRVRSCCSPAASIRPRRWRCAREQGYRLLRAGG